MKQIYMSVLLVMLFTVNVFGEQHASKFGEKEKVAVVYENNVFLKELNMLKKVAIYIRYQQL